jgi:hypothetical protein
MQRHTIVSNRLQPAGLEQPPTGRSDAERLDVSFVFKARKPLAAPNTPMSR